MHDDVKARGRRSRINAVRERERGGDVKNVHGKIGRAREEGDRQKRLEKQEDIDKTSERSDAKTFH